MAFILAASPVWPPSWDQFIPSVIATVLGVFLPFLVQSLIEKGKKKGESKELLRRIYDELKNVIDKLKQIKDNTLEQNPLKTLAWDEALNTGLISMLKPNIRKDLFAIYETISVFNSWAVVKTNYYFDHIDKGKKFNPQLNKELDDLKTKLLDNDTGIQSIRSTIKSYLKIKND